MRKMTIALVLGGTASIIYQTLLLRELAAMLGGNELIYGLSLMIWLVFGGCGSFAAVLIIPKAGSIFKATALIQIAISILAPAEIFFVRASKLVFCVPSGSIPDLATTLLIAVAAMAPISFLFGAFFVAGSRAIEDIGSMYILESIGALAGGILFTFILIFLFDPLQISGMAGFALCFSALYIYKHFIRTGRSNIKMNLVLFSAALAACLVLVYPTGPKLDHLSSGLAFRGLNVVKTADSAYGRISVVENNGAFSYFENGGLLFSTASVAENEELAHLAMLEAGSPKSVLLIGGGPSGLADEIKKHGAALDHIEYDPKLVELAGAGHPVIVADGRSYVNRTKKKYDLIIVSVGDPVTASMNRFYTLEFFDSCRERLTDKGIVCVPLSGSRTFMGSELATFNSSVRKTLGSVFMEVTVVPGNYFYYFAAKRKGTLTRDPEVLAGRWREKKIAAEYFGERALLRILSPLELRSADDAVKYGKNTRINTDLSPVSYLYGILVWLSYFPDRLSAALKNITAISLASLVMPLIILACLVKLSRKIFPFSMMPSVMFLMGSSAMTFQLVLVYSFQSFYGSLYQYIGMLSALFMGGLAAGSFAANRKMKGSKPEPLICAFSLLAAAFIPYMLNAHRLTLLPPSVIIPLFILASSSMAGAVFPAVLRNYRGPGLERKAGTIYGVDLLGGAVSALLASVLAIPVLGIVGTCLLTVIVSALTVFLAFQSS